MTLKTIDRLIKMQDELNRVTAGENWRNGVTSEGREINWGVCLSMEYAELIDSLNWKHWKDIDTPHNLENAKMELVDILHFLFSAALERGEENIVSHLLYGWEYNEEELSIRALTRCMANSTDTSNIMLLVEDFIYAAEMLGVTLDDLIKSYLGKNILNKFRQDNGYKDGTYVKIWDKDNQLEDNVYIENIINTTLDPDEIFTELTTTYNKLVIGTF